MRQKLEEGIKGAREVELVKSFDDSQKALGYAKENTVEFAVIDTEMPIMDGFSLGRRLKEICPGIVLIYTTENRELVADAIKMKADYCILKPFDKQEISQALENVKNWFVKEQSTGGQSVADAAYQERFLVQMGARIKSVPVNEVAYFMADGKYLMLYTFEGNGYVVDQTMGGLEVRLEPRSFFRVNRKFIVNYQAIKDMIRYSNSRIKIILSPAAPEDMEVIVSNERMKEFKEWLNR